MADFYTASSDPADNSDGDPAVLRAEHAAIAAGFVKVAPYTGHANEFVVINSGETAQTSLTASAALTALGAQSTSGLGLIRIAAATGTVDVITATFSPVLTLTDKMMCAIVSAGVNTVTTPTFAPDGLTAHTITARGGAALIAGDIGDAGFVALLEYNLANTSWELLNPKGGTAEKLNVGTSANNVVQLDGSAKLPAVDGSALTNVAGGTLGTPQASTSGTSIDFTGIPSGTKQITISFVGVSTSGTSYKCIQLGDAGGIETTGYQSVSSLFTAAAVTTAGDSGGIIIKSDLAADVLHGTIILTLENAATFMWTATGTMGDETTLTRSMTVSGSKATSAMTDRVRITTLGGANTFDAGEINISYK